MSTWYFVPRKRRYTDLMVGLSVFIAKNKNDTCETDCTTWSFFSVSMLVIYY